MRTLAHQDPRLTNALEITTIVLLAYFLYFPPPPQVRHHIVLIVLFCVAIRVATDRD